MFCKKLFIVLLTITMCVPMGIVVGQQVAKEDILMQPMSNEVDDIVAVTVGDYTMETDSMTLHTKVTNNATGELWDSGARAKSDDDQLNEMWQNRISDGITFGYRSKKDIRLENSISALNHTTTYTSDSDSVTINIRLLIQKITLQVKLQLTSDGKIVVTIPEDKIVETDTKKWALMDISMFPFMQNAYRQEDGFIFVPDGSGAIIDLATKSNATQAYRARVYGDDSGAPSSQESKNNIGTMPFEQIPMAVFGIGYTNRCGYLSYISQGQEHSEINATVSGMTTTYNNAYNKFIYRDMYMRFLDNKGSVVNTVQEDINKFTATQTFALLNNGKSNLPSMANLYQQKLIKEGSLVKVADSIEDIGLRLQFLMAESVNTMFGAQTVAMTSADYIRQALGELTTPLNAVDVSLLGGFVGGLSNSKYGQTNLDSSVGGKNAINKLVKYCGDNGVDISLVSDLLLAKTANGGYSNNEVAMTVANKYISYADKKNISLSNVKVDDDAYRAVTLSTSDNTLKKLIKSAKKIGIDNFELGSIGNILNSSYYNKQYARKQAIDSYRQMLTNDCKYAISGLNEYMYKVADSLVDVSMTASRYLIETDSVPFVQMVVSGYLPMYRKAINLNYMGSVDVLQMIDYNVYPSFLMTEQNAVELIYTDSKYIFTSQFSQWKDKINSIYSQVNGVLKRVKGQTFVDRQLVGQQIYCNTYSNGTKIIVNYSSQDIEYQGVSVKANSAGVIG